MSPGAYALIGLTAIVGILAGVLVYAMLRFVAAARDSRRHLREGGGAETALLSAALQDAVARLKAQEQAMSVRAEVSERLSSEIVASLTAGLLVVDGQGAVKILNPAGRRLLEHGDGDLPAHYRDLLVRSQPLAQAIDECCATGEPVLRRTVQVEHPARTLYVGVTVSPLAGVTGRGAICLFSDLTAIVELEEQLRLKEALAQLGELTAGLAHEFRNGLATIHGYARLIDPKALPGQYGAYVEGLRQETDALGQVVTRFLNFARPEQVVLAPVDLEAIVRRACDEVAHELAGARIDVSGTFGTIEGDEILLRQAFSNLVRNAVEACTAVKIPPDVRVTGTMRGENGTCRVTVEDNGPGIDPAVRHRLFRPFVSTRTNGTGLGLAIVQKIVVTHNGRIAVASSPSGGAVFHLTFPASAGARQNRQFV